MNKILELASLMRKSSSGGLMEDVFTHGGCYKFHQIVKLICPDAEPWYDGENGHVYSMVGGKLYDIFGEHEMFDGCIPFKGNYTEEWVDEANSWMYPG